MKGGSYGWRVFEGFQCTNNDAALCANPNDYLFPLFDYTHASGRCSLTGGYVYRGLQGALAAGTYVYGDYCSGEIFTWNGSAQSVLLDTTSRISSFGEDEQGELYVVDLGGTVTRIARAAACTYAITPTRATYGAGAATGTVTVTAGNGCPWTAASNDPWLAVTGGASGSVTYSVAVYTSKPKNRNGTITIAGQTLSVKQSK